MHDDGLDNPIHASLGSRHAGLAELAGALRRYPAAIAPFLGVAGPGPVDPADLASLVAADDHVYLLGVAPAPGPGWRLEAFAPLAQMVIDAPPALPDGPPIRALDEGDQAAVLALTALVYPHYFRPQTMRLGRYFGIHVDGRLAAMIGERMGTHAARELSAICTHPTFLGRGYAGRLTAWLAGDLLARGQQPFLHVSQQNIRAVALYRRLGFRLRREIGFWSLRRA
jgi:ribosomal protein S18 acetylase RimI-like enzyme